MLHGVVSLSHNKMLYFAAVSEIERKVDLCQSYTEDVFMKQTLKEVIRVFIQVSI